MTRASNPDKIGAGRSLLLGRFEIQVSGYAAVSYCALNDTLQERTTQERE